MRDHSRRPLLWYAQRLDNWKLANYELDQFKTTIDRIVKLYPAAAFEDAGIRAVAYDGADTLSRRIVAAHEMAVPVIAIVGGREMRDGRVSLRERDGSQADVPLAEAVSRLQARARPSALVAEAL